MRDWLKNLREEKGFTQEEVANKVCIAKTTYSSYEQGHRNPSVQTAKRIAKLLDFEWTIFFESEVHLTST